MRVFRRSPSEVCGAVHRTWLTQQNTIRINALSIGIATGAYGTSFGATAVLGGLHIV